MEGSGEDRREDAVYAPPSRAADAPVAEKTAERGPFKESAPVPRISLAARVAVTACATALWWGASKIPLPATDPELFSTNFWEVGGASLSIIGLGVTPIVAASGFVEMAALFVPSWRKLRHAGPAGRAKLTRASAVGALLLALFQAYALKSMLAGASYYSGQSLLVVATLMAGTFLLWGIASVVSLWGLGNGVVWLLVLEALGRLARWLVSGPAAGDSRLWTLGGLCALITVGATSLALRAAREAPRPFSSGAASADVADEPDGADKAPVHADGADKAPVHADGADKAPVHALSVPTPASGATASKMFVVLPVLFLAWHIPADSPLSKTRPLGMGLLVAVTVGFALAFSYLFQRPSRMRGVLSRLRVEPASGGETFARDLVRRALVPTVMFELALGFCSLMSADAVLALTLLTAWILDAVDARKARREGPWVTVWTEERPLAAVAARAALARNGIALYTEGLLTRTMLQFGAGYAPIRLQVREKDATRAARHLREALPDPVSAPEGGVVETPALASAKKKAPKKKRPLAASRAIVGGASPGVKATLVAAAIAGFILAIRWIVPVEPQGFAALTPTELAQRSQALQLVLVDDDHDPLEKVVTASDVPSGVRFERENAPIGAGKTQTVFYVFAAMQPGETLSALEARLRPWLDKIEVPKGTHLALESVTEANTDTGAQEVVGLRTMLVHDEAFITGADVMDALARPDKANPGRDGWLVSVQLTKEAGLRFEEVTRQNVKRRIAIMVNGRIMSAPVVQTAIAGGNVVITMGAGSLEEQKRSAIELERALRP